jgi:hypothetical protein
VPHFQCFRCELLNEAGLELGDARARVARRCGLGSGARRQIWTRFLVLRIRSDVFLPLSLGQITIRHATGAREPRIQVRVPYVNDGVWAA